MKRDNHYLGWGITAVAVVCSILLIYDIVFRDSIVLQYASQFVRIMAPVTYGAFIAYLLAYLFDLFLNKFFGNYSWFDIFIRPFTAIPKIIST